MIQVQTFMLGQLGANCHILTMPTGEAVAVDIGAEPQRILQILKSQNLRLHTILLTHGHYDHFGGVAQVQKQTGAQVFIHEADAPMLTDRKLSLADYVLAETFEPVTEFETFTEGETISAGEFCFQVLHTPGHSKGSVCYLCETMLFTGDTLFRRSIGRTDFPGGSSREIRASLRRLGTLEGEYSVYPGHLELTTLSAERRENHYLTDLPR